MCAKGNHIAGQIGTQIVRINAWDKTIGEFEIKLKAFKSRGNGVKALDPGNVTRFSYCPDCGASQSLIPLRGLDV